MMKRTIQLFFACLLVMPFILSLTPSAGSGLADDPITADHFQVQWGGSSMEFHSVEGLESRVEVLEYRDGLSPDYNPTKLPGSVHHSNIILRRAYKEYDNDMWNWYKESLDGEPEYRSITISILDTQHTPTVTFKIAYAWPCAYRGPVLMGNNRQVALEELEITYKSLSVENE